MVPDIVKNGESIENYPNGEATRVIFDIEGVRTLVDFKVIDILEDSNPYPTLLGIDWATDMNGLINLKKWKMIFERKSLSVVVSLDPTKGPHYTEPL